MSDSPFELHVDDDWKKQAREEKRRLAEESEKKKAAGSARAAPAAPSAAPGRSPAAQRPQREASFAGLVDLLAGQIRLYLGAVPVSANGEGIVDLDAAKTQLDLLAVLETKAAGNLDDAEQQALDVALYESRTRFSSVASRYIL